MAWRAARSLLTLHRQLKAGSRAAPPATPADAWGLVGDAAHDPTSDHAPHNFPGWGSEIVTAADFPNRPDLGLDAHKVLDDIRRSRDPRVKYAISNGQIFSNHDVWQDGVFYPAWTWRPYKGSNKHYDHGHLSVVGDARADGEQPWATIGGADMTPEESKALFEVRDRLRWIDPRIAATTEGRETYQDAANKPWPARDVVERRALAAAVDAVDAKVDALQAGQVPQDAVSAAVAAALADPAVLGALVKAINDDAARRAAE